MTREPLHQPPNPDDLRRVPPAGPACARVRGWLRDFVDGDLDREARQVVEHHVHRCRTCSVELARAEHEVLRLRQVFARQRAHEPALPSGFAARVVARLVADETSLVSVAELQRAVAAADSERRSAEPAPAAGRGSRIGPAAMLSGALVLLLALGLGFHLFHDGSSAPERVARLVVVAAERTCSLNGRQLEAGDGLGEQQALWVRPGGGAQIEWHDKSAQPQPAASMRVHDDGQLHLMDGMPRIAKGRIEVATNRSVEIAVGDGSRLELGLGEYLIAADIPFDLDPSTLFPPGVDPSQSLPVDLLVEVEVRAGEPATIVRAGQAPTLVAAGQVGIYTRSSAVRITSSGGAPIAAESGPYTRSAPGPGDDGTGLLSGHVFDRNGAPGVGAEVMVRFLSGGALHNASRVTGSDGSFVVAFDDACDSDFAVVMAAPASIRRELGVLPPHAVPLERVDGRGTLAAPLVFDLATPFQALVRDDLQQPCAGVLLVPCVVDELLGLVTAIVGERSFSGSTGLATLERLPASLPPHQSLVVLVSHGDLEPLVVPIPMRGTTVAGQPFPPVQARRLRSVRLHELPGNAAIEIFEEIPGLPTGSAAWRRTAFTDSFGRVSSIEVGWGRMWVRHGGPANPFVRELVLDDFAGLPRYRPAVGAPKAFSSLFRTLQPVPDSSAQIASAYRHQDFPLGTAASTTSPRALRVADDVDRPIAGAQVFAVGAVGPRGAAAPRFLGFTSAIGVMSLQAVQSGEGVLVLGADGGTALLPEPLSGPPNVSVTLQPAGRVLLHESLRVDAPSVLPIRFERLDATLPGMAPMAFRFASGSTEWLVGDLPPGQYRAHLPGGSRDVFVPAGGFVVMQ